MAFTMYNMLIVMHKGTFDGSGEGMLKMYAVDVVSKSSD